MINKKIIIGGFISLGLLGAAGVAGGVYWKMHSGSGKIKAGLGSSGAAGFQTENAFKFAELIQANVLYSVVHVDDGDTFVVHVPDQKNADGHDLTVRLIGMDTPETVDPRKPVQCYGPEASAKGKELLGGASIYLEKDPLKGDYEKYGRVLAYARLADGSLYNEYMIKNGFAREYTFAKEPYKYQKEFKADQVAAKKAKVGLWGKCQNK